MESAIKKIESTVSSKLTSLVEKNIEISFLNLKAELKLDKKDTEEEV